MTMSAGATRLRRRLTSMGIDLPEEIRVERISRGGTWQAADGALKFDLRCADYRALPFTDGGRYLLGSHYRLTDLLREPRLMVTRDDLSMTWSIDPYDERVHDRYARFGGRAYAEPPTTARR